MLLPNFRSDLEKENGAHGCIVRLKHYKQLDYVRGEGLLSTFKITDRSKLASDLFTGQCKEAAVSHFLHKINQQINML